MGGVDARNWRRLAFTAFTALVPVLQGLPTRARIPLSPLSSQLSIHGLRSFSTSTHSGDVTQLGEKVVYDGFRKVVRRDVLLPNGKPVSFDVVVQENPSVVVFVWDSKTATTTLVREYHPGPNKSMLGVVAGLCEPGKHASILEAAQHELEEEACLQTSHWFPLLNGMDVHAPLDKYSSNQFFPFLALDCQPVSCGRPADDEEHIEVEQGIPLPKLLELVHGGHVNLVSSYTILLGLRKLKELGISVET